MSLSKPVNSVVLNTAQVAAMSGDVAKGVSICIPRVFANISANRIRHVFKSLNWGHIERIDMTKGGGTQRAFVHFKPGRFTNTAVLTALCEGKPVKVVYDEPWYWMLSLSRSVKPTEAPERPKQFKVEIGKEQRAPGRRKLTLDLTTVSEPVTFNNDPIASRIAAGASGQEMTNHEGQDEGEIVETTN